MLSPRWRKVLGDIWRNKARSLLVILSIAVGGFALGTVVHMRLLVGRDLVESYAAIHPAQVVIYTERGFDRDFVTLMANLQEVQAVERRRSMVMRFKLKPEEEWRPIRIFALDDYENIEVNLVRPEEYFEPDPQAWPNPYVWPPPDRALLLERTSLLLAHLGLSRDAEQGDEMLLEIPGGKVRSLPMAGLCYDFSQTPATFSGMAYGFITFETLEWLGLPQNFNELHIIVDASETRWDVLKEHARSLQDRVERAGYTVTKVDVPEPGKLPLDSMYQAITLVLGVMGGFALFLAIFLVINTISALLVQQVKHIGVMKAIGARAYQLMGMYLSIVAIFGLGALLIAIPLAAFVAYHAVQVMAYFINFKLSDFTLSPEVIIIQAVVMLLVPVLAAILPVWNGVRVTVREAISTYGLSANFGTGFLDRMVESVRSLPRPLLLSLRNTFRRKFRLALTLITLTLAGMVVVAVLSVRVSMDATLDEVISYWQFDVQLQFMRPYRIQRIEYEAAQVPNVAAIEGWGSASTYLVRPDGSSSESFGVTAVPADTQMLAPELTAGRWLEPADERGLIINSFLWSLEPDIAMGDFITLKIGGRESVWQVLGVVKTVGNVPGAYVDYDVLAQETRRVGVASSIQIKLADNGAEQQEKAAELLEARFEAVGMNVASKITSTQQRAQSATLFDIIVTQLLIMAALMVVVGGLGLTGTMSLNVLERTREIGVMRAVGASNDALMQIVLSEGLLIGGLSWGLGALLAWPFGAILSYVVGLRFLNAPLSYVYSFSGALIWLAVVMGLSAAATYLPAQRAVQLSVRETLAYE